MTSLRKLLSKIIIDMCSHYHLRQLDALQRLVDNTHLVDNCSLNWGIAFFSLAISIEFDWAFLGTKSSNIELNIYWARTRGKMLLSSWNTVEGSLNMNFKSNTSSPGPASNYYNRNDGNHQPGSSSFFGKTVIWFSNLQQVAEEAGKQGFWDKLRNTFVRE